MCRGFPTVTHPRLLCDKHRAERAAELNRRRALRFRNRNRNGAAVRTVRLAPDQTLPIVDALTEVARFRDELAREQEAGRARRSTFEAYLAATDTLCERTSAALTPVTEDLALTPRDEESR